MDRLVESALEVLELARRGVDVDVVGNVGALAGAGLCAHPCQSSARADRSPTRAHLSTPSAWPRYGVEVSREAGSTNALVADRAREGAPEWLVVATEHQTAGRGRLDRTWETPDRAALTFSTLLRPERTGRRVAVAAAARRASPRSGRCASTASRPA